MSSVTYLNEVVIQIGKEEKIIKGRNQKCLIALTPAPYISEALLVLPNNELGSLQKRETDRKTGTEMGCDKHIDMKVQLVNEKEQKIASLNTERFTEMVKLTEMAKSTKKLKVDLIEENSREYDRLIEKFKKANSDFEGAWRLWRQNQMHTEMLNEGSTENLLGLRENVLDRSKELEECRTNFMKMEHSKATRLMESKRLMESIGEINKNLLREADSLIQTPLMPPSDKGYLDGMFIRVNMEHDIHSLFRVFSHQIFGDQCHFRFFRHAISTQLRENHSEYGEHVLGDYHLYCDKVATDLRGDLLCIKAACDLFRVSFVQLWHDPADTMTEVVPAKKLSDDKHVFCRKVIYFSENNTGIHSLVLKSDQDLDDLKADDLKARLKKIDKLKQHSNDPNIILDICRSLLEDQSKMVVPKGHYRRHSLRLSFFRFQRKTMIGDGNCLFRSLSDQIFNNEEHHFMMRSVIVAQLKEHPSRYLNLRSVKSRESETYDQYCYRMASDKVWGDLACIQAACDAFGVKSILLYSQSSLIFLELYPIGPWKKVIFGCGNNHHMDVMYPLELPGEAIINDTEINDTEMDLKESLIALFKERVQ